MGHILVVDDDIDSLALCRTVLKPLQHEISITSSPKNALEMIKKQDFDLLIVDVVMPHLNGFEFLRELRKQGGFRGSVLMLTGRRTAQDVLTALELGAIEYVCKPIDKEIFLAKVQSALGPIGQNQPKVDFAGETVSVKADIVLSAVVTSVTELGMTFLTDTPLLEKNHFKLQSELFKKMDVPAPPIRVLSCEEKEAESLGVRYRFEIKGGFVGLDDYALKKIRKWLLAHASTKVKVA